MKIAHIEAEFPDLKGDNRATGTGEGSTVRAAISRAIADLFVQDNVRRKRINSVNMTVILTKKAVE